MEENSEGVVKMKTFALNEKGKERVNEWIKTSACMAAIEIAVSASDRFIFRCVERY